MKFKLFLLRVKHDLYFITSEDQTTAYLKYSKLYIIYKLLTSFLLFFVILFLEIIHAIKQTFYDVYFACYSIIKNEHDPHHSFQVKNGIDLKNRKVIRGIKNGMFGTHFLIENMNNEIKKRRRK